MKKYRYILFLVLVILFCFIKGVTAKNDYNVLLSKVIYIDPGHGGADSGAYYRNIKESDVNLEISTKLMNGLKKEGATVYLTRYGD